MPSTIDRYVFKEMAVPFLLSLAILTVTALLSKVIKLIELMVTHGVGPSFIFRFVVSVIPSFLIYTIPVSFLIGVLVAFTRLSSDSEIVAMKASGISLFSVMRPVAVLAVIACSMTLAFTLYVYPWGNINLKKLLFDAAKTRLVAGLEEKTFYDKFKGVILYVDRITPQTGEMEGIFISEAGAGKKAGAKEGQADNAEANVFFAPRGIFSQSTDDFTVYLKLYDGTIHRRTAGNGSYHIADFSTYLLKLTLTGGSPEAGADKPNRELYTRELMEKIELVKSRGEDAAPFEIDLHKRFALPASVFVFALIGVPLGIQKIRAARFTGFSVALAVVLVYYIASTGFEALGEGSKINPVLAVWGSDIIFAMAGLYVFYRAAKDSPVDIPGWLAGVYEALRGRGRQEAR